MNNSDIELKKNLFASVFFLSNKLELLGDRYLSSAGLTTRQWMLTIVVNGFGENYPTLGEAAEEMATSHQSARQIASKLEARGYLIIEKDEKDKRALRLKVTDKCRKFWEDSLQKDNQFINRLFDGFGSSELQSVMDFQYRFYEQIQLMGRKS